MAKSKDVKKSKKEDKVKKVKSSKSSSSKVKKSKEAKRKVSTITPITEKFTRTTLIEAVATTCGVEKKDVKKVYLAMEAMMLGSLIKKGRGEFIWPTLFKIVTKEKPATKARKGISPFTGEECMFKAKPKTTVVKIRPLGKVKKAAKNEI
jgi:nucleoid DNA-binding protein